MEPWGQWAVEASSGFGDKRLSGLALGFRV